MRNGGGRERKNSETQRKSDKVTVTRVRMQREAERVRVSEAGVEEVR